MAITNNVHIEVVQKNLCRVIQRSAEISLRLQEWEVGSTDDYNALQNDIFIIRAFLDTALNEVRDVLHSPWPRRKL